MTISSAVNLPIPVTRAERPAPGPGPGDPAPPPDGVDLSSPLKRAARLAMGVAGGAVGAVAGAVAGSLVGGALGAVIGAKGKTPLVLDGLRDLCTVAGLGGAKVHSLTERFVSAHLGEKAGRIAAAVAGTTVGVVAGAVVGVLGGALSCADMGARLATLPLGPAPAPVRDSSKPTYEQGKGPQLPTPDGEINQDQHHWFQDNAAMTVLAKDAQSDPSLAPIYQFLSSDPEYLNMIQMGGWNMDTFRGEPLPLIQLATFDHFAEPFVPGRESATWKCRQAYDRAADAWKAGDHKLAMYYLGAAVHLIQDMAYPQHSVRHVGFIGKTLGHPMMERFIETNFDRLAPDSGGRYLDVETPEELAEVISEEASADYKEALQGAWAYTRHRVQKERQGLPTDPAEQTDFESPVYRRATHRAVGLTPGFYRMFFKDMSAQGYPLPESQAGNP